MTAEDSFDFSSFIKFERHSPALLQSQIVASIKNKGEITYDKSILLDSSMERFYGALVLIDISGFTLLSQKLSLDVLKTQIKAFFHLIITIIENAGGQVIKFAGDAIFAIWRQNLESGNNVLSL